MFIERPSALIPYPLAVAYSGHPSFHALHQPKKVSRLIHGTKHQHPCDFRPLKQLHPYTRRPLLSQFLVGEGQAVYSGRIRLGIPVESVHAFRWK